MILQKNFYYKQKTVGFFVCARGQASVFLLCGTGRAVAEGPVPLFFTTV